MTDYEDMIFQAQCQIDYLADHFENGGTLQSCRDDLVLMHLGDESETTINLEPIQRLLDALRRLPGRPS
jgi:hypothetical protein